MAFVEAISWTMIGFEMMMMMMMVVLTPYYSMVSRVFFLSSNKTNGCCLDISLLAGVIPYAEKNRHFQNVSLLIFTVLLFSCDWTSVLGYCVRRSMRRKREPQNAETNERTNYRHWGSSTNILRICDGAVIILPLLLITPTLPGGFSETTNRRG